MESIKTTLRSNLQAEHGDVTLVFDVKDKGFSICVHRFPAYIIFVRPNDRETHYLCHYAHREDLERTEEDNKERQEWRQQAVFQLRWSCKGGERQCAAIVTDYVRRAVERMELYKDVGGRGFYTRIRTFEEAKLEQRWNPKPRKPDPANPPPLCRRHTGVYREAEKRKRTKEQIAGEVAKRTKACAWRP